MENIFDLDDVVVNHDEDVDYVEQLVGEGKKFKDLKALARGKVESDTYIAKLKEELENAKKELTTRVSLEKFLEEQRGKEPQADRGTPAIEKTVEFDENSLASKLEELLQRREAAKSQETNREYTERVLRENFGDNVKGVLAQKVKELGMSGQALESLAVSSPKAFLQLVGAAESRNPQVPVVPRSGVNTVAAPGGSSIRNAAYYERMKVNDPKRYWSDATVSEMMRDRAALGANFYN